MTQEDLSTRIDKIFRANTIEVKEEYGQFGEYKMVKQIEDIEELKQDIKDLLKNEFKVGKLKRDEIFVGTGKLGASYHIKEAIEVAKKWGYKYVAWNGNQIHKLNGEALDITLDEI